MKEEMEGGREEEKRGGREIGREGRLNPSRCI